VAGAQAAGLKGILVRTGKYGQQKEGMPDLVLGSVAGLPEALGIQAVSLREEGGP
jgi:ribonucleotide monophosphatase NagD (HAD superfamily)